MNQPHGPKRKCLGLAGSLGLGSVGFAVVSVSGFAVWAVLGNWLGQRVGGAGLFGACALVFLGLSGALLHPLICGPKRMARFYATFIPAFCAYAVAWCAAWFIFHFGLGEWLASLFGCLAFAVVLCWRFGNYGNFIRMSAVLFALHSAGYFFGSVSMHWREDGRAGWLAKLVWGCFYGLGFGAGIGYDFSAVQKLGRRRDDN